MTTLVGWHGTDADFETFSEDRFGSDETRSPNGALGVWVYTREGLAEHAGRHVLEVVAEPGRTVDLGIVAMRRDHERAIRSDDPVGYFVARRAELRAQGYDAIRFVETDGSSAISVILDLDRITSVTRLEASPTP